MKKLIVLAIGCIIVGWNTYGFSQDVIIKKNGEKIEVKIIEISSKEVKYYNFTQPNGPIRILATHELTEIIYENGEFEKFDVKENVSRTNETVIYENRRPAPKYAAQDMMGAGFAVDFLIGASQFSRTDFSYFYDPFNPFTQTQKVVDNSLVMSFRISNKFYFDATPKWRAGVQVSYIRLGARIGNVNYLESFIISPLHFGMANIIRLNDKFGLEVNMIAGLTGIVSNGFGNSFHGGLTLNPEVKFRYKVLAIGIDYSRTSDIFDEPEHRLHQLSLSIGAKF